MTLSATEVVDVPEAVVDVGVPGRWPTLVDPARLLPAIWRRVVLLIDRVQTVTTNVAVLAGRVQTNTTRLDQHHDEINAIESTLGTMPQGSAATVAARLTEIEARLGP